MPKHQLTPQEQARLAQMDADAETAKKAFAEMVKSDAVDLKTIEIVGAWFAAFWLTAGYKRLAKILLDWTHNRPPEG